MENKFKGLNINSVTFNNPLNDVVEKSRRQHEEMIRNVEDKRIREEELEEKRHNQLKEILNSAIANGSVYVGDNASGVQIQHKTINSSQSIVNTQSFNYDAVEDILNQIKEFFEFPKFDETFGDKSEIIKSIVEETMLEVGKKSEPTLIMKSLGIIKDIAIGASGSLIGSGIIGLLATLA